MPCLLSVFACQKEAEVLYFRVLDIFLTNGVENDTNFKGFDELHPNEEVSYYDYRLILGIGVEYFSAIEEDHFSFPGMIPSLMANDPGDPIPSQDLESISIVSNSDFIFHNGVVIPAGSSLNAYFVTSIDEISQNMNVDEYLEWAKTPREDAVFFKLLEAPKEEQTHRFNVWYKIKGVPNFSTTADPVLISF